jgi:hypothetical protein
MSVKVLDIKEGSDGSATMTIDYDQEFLDNVKQKIGKDPTEQDISDYVVGLIEKEIERVDKCIDKWKKDK